MVKSAHLVDPELVAAASMFPQPDYWAEPLGSIRQTVDSFTALLPVPDRAAIGIEERQIPARGGHQIGVTIYSPTASSAPRPGVLHIHGGGYIVGSHHINAATNAAIAAEASCTVVSVDYRLSPESQHPGPVEDCYSALGWLHQTSESLGIDRARVAVMGESAGGGLAAALSILARDRGEYPISYQQLFYPMIDDRTCIAPPHPYAGEFVWTADANRFGWTSLLGCTPGSGNISPYAAAARAEDLEGLPRTFISVGALDLFIDENLEFARRLIRAGVPTELHVYPGAYHAFDMVDSAKVAQAAKRNAMAALRSVLHPNTKD